eukprot:PITA_31975
MATTGLAFVRQGTLHFAGSCRPNPGHGSIGFIIYNDHDASVLEKFSAYINHCFRLRSNVAHYKALIAGLQHALLHGITHITALGHCKVLIDQVERNCAVDTPWLKRYCNRVRKLTSHFQSFQMRHIYSEDNSDAYSLAWVGYNSTFVDQSNSVEREILRRCRDPESAKKYVLDQSCDGYHKTKYILDTIECRLLESYETVQKMCTNISKKMGSCWVWNNNRVLASLLGLY